MGDASFTELLVVLAIGLVVLGPERLPRIANQLGRWVGQARRMTRVMKRQLEDELNLDKMPDIKPPARSQHTPPAPYKPPAPPATAVPPTETETTEFDDTYSPAHDADSPGTGVASTLTDTKEEPPGNGGADSADEIRKDAP